MVDDFHYLTPVTALVRSPNCSKSRRSLDGWLLRRGLGQVANRYFDTRLAKAFKEGEAALSGNLTELRGYLITIDEMLEEKARDLEETWDAACEASEELIALQALEVTVLERVISVGADTLADILTKFAIWHSLFAECEEAHSLSPFNRLLLSIERDIQRLDPQFPADR